jgi:hypothetical protein
MYKFDPKVLDAIEKAHEQKIAEANTEAEKQKVAREKARAERKNSPMESKNSLSGRKNGKIVYTDGTEEILLYDDGIKEITNRQFGTNVAEVTLPTSVTKIGYSAFSDCESLTKIEIPDSVVNIGAFAFGGCKSLTHVTIPEGVTEIGDYAFNGCLSLETLEILGNAKIKREAFSPCLKLKNIYFPNVTEIEWSAFQYCADLEKVTLPQSLQTLYSSNFSHCPKLTCVTFPIGIKEIKDDCFYSSEAFNEVNLSVADGVSEINKEDFCWCPAMAWKPPVPGRTKMGRRSFPKIEKVGLIIPRSITAINDSALEYIPNLKNIYYAGTKEEFAKIKIGKNNPKINGLFGKAKIHYNSTVE